MNRKIYKWQPHIFFHKKIQRKGLFCFAEVVAYFETENNSLSLWGLGGSAGLIKVGLDCGI